jgi:hypothetical protein
MQYIACTHTHQRKTRMRPRASRHVMLLLCRGTTVLLSPSPLLEEQEGRRREQQGIELDLVLSAKVRGTKVHGPPLLLRRLRRVFVQGFRV